MGQVRRRQLRYWTACRGSARRACAAEGHAIDVRTLPIWWIRYYRNGRRFEESAHSEKRGDAERLLKLREGDVAKGAPISAKIGRLKFDEASADLVTDYRINAKKSIAHVERHVKQLTTLFGGRRMSELNGADVRRYIESRQSAGAANATINRELAALRRSFTLAVDSGKLIAKPKIQMLQENNARQGFFERGQFVNVLAHLSPACRRSRRSRTTPAGGAARSSSWIGSASIARRGSCGSTSGPRRTRMGGSSTMATSRTCGR